MVNRTWQVDENIHVDGKLKFFNTKFEGSEKDCESYLRNHSGENLTLGYSVSDNPFFDSYGNFIGEIPEVCVIECSLPGKDASEAVRCWTLELEFMLPSLKMGRKYLVEFGAWEDLDEADMFTLSQRVLWLACNDIKESGEWLGLIH